jgi:hypothetical protein
MHVKRTLPGPEVPFDLAVFRRDLFLLSQPALVVTAPLKECAETSNERALHVQISAVSCKSNWVRRVGQDFEHPEESREFQKLKRRFASFADNEQVLADDHKRAVDVSSPDQSRGAALAVEEEYVLRCLGAELIMQWNTLPTTLQGEVFDTAGAAGKLLEATALRGQIARFLHKHKNDCGCNKLAPTEDTHSDARFGCGFVAVGR